MSIAGMGWIVDRVKWASGKLTPSGRSSDGSQAQPSAAAARDDTSAPEPEAKPGTSAETESSSDTDAGKTPESEAGEPRSKNDTQEHDTLDRGTRVGSKDEGSKRAAEPARTATTTRGDSGDNDKSGSDDENDASDITAPSIGPDTVIEHEPPEERLDLDKISDTDAMGNDKRREVVGQRYSASPARQATLYGIFVVVLIAMVIGGKALADKLDEPPKTVEDQAPWTGSENHTQQDLDFPKYGKPAS